MSAAAMQDAVAAIGSAIAQQQAALRTALRAGANTRSIRARLAELEKELQDIRTSADVASTAAAAAEARAIEERTSAIVRERLAAIQGAVAALAAPPSPVDLVSR